ncbi:MAG TPA: hypothetical protein VK936_09590 [Longimicrobiales bacterium]|nr:hypothetical protein [Longimicrobiales bacterium]
MRRRPLVVAAALVILHVFLGLLTFQPRPHTGGDNAAYITLGESLLERGAYLELWDPAEPPHTKYPPVFPAVLAVAMALGLQPWVQLKLVVLGFSAAAVATAFFWMRSRRRAALGLAVAALLAVSPGVLRESRWVLSDVPFWAFSMVALWAFDRLRADDWPRFGVATAATLLALFTRSAGLPLVLAAGAWLAWRRRWTQLGLLSGAAAVLAALWWLRSRAFASGYVSEFWLVEPYQPELGTIGPADLVARIVENLQKYITIHLPTLLAEATGVILLAISAAAAVLALWGWARRMHQPRVAELFLPAYLGLILVWPAVWSGERFLLPVLPLLLFLAGESLARLVRRFGQRGAAVAMLPLAVVLALMAPALVRAADAGRECTARYRGGERYPCLSNPFWIDFFELAGATGDALPEGAVVLNRKPRLFHVLSGGVKARNYPLSSDAAAFFAAADSAGARYVIFDRLDDVSEYYLRPILVLHSSAFCVMRASQRTGTALFALVPGHDVETGATGAAREDGTISFAVCEADYWRDEEAMRRYGPR